MPANRFGSLVQVQVVLISAKTKNVSDRYTHTHTHKLKLDSLPTSAVCCLCFFRAHIIFLSLPATWRKDCDWTDLIYRQLTLTSIFFSTWSHLLSNPKKKTQNKNNETGLQDLFFLHFCCMIHLGLVIGFCLFYTEVLPIAIVCTLVKWKKVLSILYFVCFFAVSRHSLMCA